VLIGDSGIVAFHGVAYANTDRLVLDHSDLHLAGGIVRTWARVSRGTIARQMMVDLDGLQLDQFAHVINPKIASVPGLIFGKISIVGSGFSTANVQANARLSLTESDLAAIKPLQVLYNTMNVGGGGGKPNGKGTLELHLEQNNLQMTAFRYYNRGVDARGIATVFDIWHFRQAPVGGQLVGTFHLFKDTELPYLATVDEAFAELQSTLTTVNVTGTLGSLKATLASTDDLAANMKSFLVGDTRAESDIEP